MSVWVKGKGWGRKEKRNRWRYLSVGLGTAFYFITIFYSEYSAETMEKIKLLNVLSKNNVWDDRRGKPRVLSFGEDRKAAHGIHNWFLSVRIF
jgi:hypothetical protein